MKICCLYLTYIKSLCNCNFETLYNNIQTYNEYTIDLYVYVNDDGLNDIIYNNNYCNFSYNKLQEKLNYIHCFDDKKPLYEGNCQLPLIDLYLNHPEYDKYICYEDDVSYIGKENMFNLFDFNKDILFNNERILENDYYWYNRQDTHNLSLTPYSGTLNIYMFSKNVIQKIYEFMQNGNYGFFEYLINSYIMENYKKYNWDIGFIKGKNDIHWINIDLKYDGQDFIHPIKDNYQLNNYKLHNNIIQKKKYCIYYITTGVYINNAIDFFKSLHNFMPNDSKTVIWLSDNFINIDINDKNIDIIHKNILDMPWPLVTLLKMHYIYDNKINGYDGYFFFNANSKFINMSPLLINNIVTNLSQNKLITTNHSCYPLTYNKQYSQACFFGGNYNVFFNLCKLVTEKMNNILKQANAVIPLYYDEPVFNDIINDLHIPKYQQGFCLNVDILKINNIKDIYNNYPHTFIIMTMKNKKEKLYY